MFLLDHAVDDYVSPKGSHMSKWHCVCDCSNEIDVIGMSLINGDMFGVQENRASSISFPLGSQLFCEIARNGTT